MDNNWINNALELQKVDLQIRDYNMRLATIPTQIATLQKTIQTAQLSCDTQKKRIHQLEIELKETENAIGIQEQIVVKMLANSSMIRKQEEYNAAHEEIAHSKEKKSELETIAIELMDTLESSANELKTLSKTTQDICENATQEINDLKEISSEITLKIAQLTELRQAQTKHVNSEFLSIYERLISRGRGLPLAPIDNFVCGNCHMRVTQQAVNDAKGGLITLCGNCSHILYIKE